MEEIQRDIKEIKHAIHAIDKTLAVNTQSLVEHVKRTELAETRLSRVERWVVSLLTAILVGVVGLLVRSMLEAI
jgi:cell division septal protein FtsQ